MSAYAGPEAITNSLVFAYDMGNTDKSWKGAPTTNLYSAIPSFVNWNSQDIIVTNTETGVQKIYSTSGVSVYPIFSLAIPSPDAVTPMSYSLKVRGVGSVYGQVHQANIVPNGGATAVSGSSITLTSDWQTIFVQYYLCTGTTWHNSLVVLSAGIGNYVEVKEVQIEKTSFFTPYVNGVRSTTQTLVDLTSKNTITATSLTYASNNTFSFNGTSDYIIPSNITDTMLNSDSWSLSCWIKFTAVNTGSDNNIATHGVPPTMGGALHLVERSGYLYFGLYGYDLSGARPVSAGTWYNVVFTYNYTSRLKTTYINGSYDNSYAHTVGYIGTGGNFRLGRAHASSVYLNASMPSVQFYTKELSATEVKQNFNALRGRYGI